MTLKRILIYLLTISTSVLAKRSFTFSISNITCLKFGPLVKTLECELESVNNQNVINVNAMSAKDLTSLQVKVKSDLTRSFGGPMTLFDVTIDGCKLLKAKTSNSIIQVVLMRLQKFDHFPKECPVKANQKYTVSRLALDPDIFPLYTPEFNYTTDIRIIVESKVICQILASGSVESIKKSVVMRRI